MDVIYIVIIIFMFALILLLLYRLKKKNIQYLKLYEKFKDIIILENYIEKIRKENDEIIFDKKRTISELENQISELKKDYTSKHGYFELLTKEIDLYEEQQEIMSYGLYKPHFDFGTSEAYKISLDNVRNREKDLVKNENAAICLSNWTVNGSITEGKKQTKHYIKLMLRAFNGECEALIADVRWNNIQKMEDRIQKAYDAINKLGETHSIEITKQYYKLKLDELRLTYEYQEKLFREKEEQKKIQEQIREEEKAQKEIEKALKETEDSEKKYNKALEQVRKEMEKAQGDDLLILQNRITQLQKELSEAQNLRQKALSMAQQTKAGHIYVISNIGSFGENIYKIGMSRRLEPMERIRELSGASVPFGFDVHAIIYSENAPELESLIHKTFDYNKINLVNSRKEFFNVAIDEIESVVKKYDSNIDIIKIPEAREFKESNAIRESRNQKTHIDKEKLFSFPMEI